MQAEASRTNFDLREISGRRAGQSLCQVHRERHLHARVQRHDDARRAAIIASGDGMSGMGAAPAYALPRVPIRVQ